MSKSIIINIKNMISEYCYIKGVKHNPEIRIDRQKDKGDFAFVSLKRLSSQVHETPKEIFDHFLKVFTLYHIEDISLENDSVIHIKMAFDDPNYRMNFSYDGTISRKFENAIFIEGFSDPFVEPNLKQNRTRRYINSFNLLNIFQRTFDVSSPSISKFSILSPMDFHTKIFESMVRKFSDVDDFSKLISLYKKTDFEDQSNDLYKVSSLDDNYFLVDILKKYRTIPGLAEECLKKQTEIFKHLNPEWLMGFQLADGHCTDQVMYDDLWDILTNNFTDREVTVIHQNTNINLNINMTAIPKRFVDLVTVKLFNKKVQQELPSIHVAASLVKVLLSAAKTMKLTSNHDLIGYFFYPENLSLLGTLDDRFSLSYHTTDIAIELANMYLEKKGYKWRISSHKVGEMEFDSNQSDMSALMDTSLRTFSKIYSTIYADEQWCNLNAKEFSEAQLNYTLISGKRSRSVKSNFNKRAFLHLNNKNNIFPYREVYIDRAFKTIMKFPNIPYLQSVYPKRSSLHQRMWLASHISQSIPALRNTKRKSGFYIDNTYYRTMLKFNPEIEELSYQVKTDRDILIQMATLDDVISKTRKTMDLIYLTEWLNDMSVCINRRFSDKTKVGNTKLFYHAVRLCSNLSRILLHSSG